MSLFQPKNTVRAIYSYQASRPDELSFTQGTLIYNVSKENDDWLVHTHTHKVRERASIVYQAVFLCIRDVFLPSELLTKINTQRLPTLLTAGGEVTMQGECSFSSQLTM